MTTQDTTITMRRCIGSTKFGIETHQAPAADFPVQPSQKDGLGRMCKPHWRAYTNGLRKDALARRAAETSKPDAAPEAPAHEHTLAASLVGEGKPIESPAQRRGRRSKAQAETVADAA